MNLTVWRKVGVCPGTENQLLNDSYRCYQAICGYRHCCMVCNPLNPHVAYEVLIAFIHHRALVSCATHLR